MSKSTPQSASVKFGLNGKEKKKKNIGDMFMSYKNVYVASISMGADYNQSVKAIKEAEAYKGVSVILCNSPCIDWGFDMKDSNL